MLVHNEDESQVKVLVLRKNNSDSSENVKNQLSQLSHALGKNCSIEFLDIAKNMNEQSISKMILDAQYDIVIVDENNPISAWDIIQNCEDNAPIFYLDGNVDKIIDKEAKLAHFSGAVAITKDSQPFFKAAYGEANRSHHLPNNIQTKFSIGSIGKMLTAVAVMKMAEDCHISLHKPIRNFIPANYPHKDIFKDFTLHELLTHTSGLPGGVQEPFFKTDMIRFKKLAKTAPWLKSDSVIKDKGIKQRRKEHHYSNAGFFILGFAIEAITGKDYYQYVLDNVCKPANMLNTFPQRKAADHTFAIPYPKKPQETFDLEQKWLTDATNSEQNIELQGYLRETEKIIQDTQKYTKNIYLKVEQLQKDFENAVATIQNEEVFLDFQNGFIIKIKNVMTDFNKYKSVIKTLGDNRDQIIQWIHANQNDSSFKETMNIADELLKINDKLLQIYDWPNIIFGSFINTLSMAHPAGCWFSTTSDLIALNEALWNPQGALLKYAKKMISPNEAKENGYGYGIACQDRGDGEEAKGHFGGVPGGRSSNFHYPHQKMNIVTFMNDETSIKLSISLQDNLVFGTDNDVKYFDPRLNDNQNSIVDDAKKILVNKKQQNIQHTNLSLFTFSPNLELKKLYDEDQAERLNSMSDPKHDKERRDATTRILKDLKYPTKEDYYHAAIIFQHGDQLSDYKKAHQYAKKSLQLGRYKPDTPNAEDNLFLVAATFDRWQLNQIPPYHQKYGTQYAVRDDNKKGWKKNELIPPFQGFVYDLKRIDAERTKLGLCSLQEQETKWGIRQTPTKGKKHTHMK